MIGRPAELTALAAAVTAPDGRPVVLLGEEGIGKTTLLHAAARLAATHGFEVVWSGSERGALTNRPVAVLLDDAHLMTDFPCAPGALLLAAATGPVPPEALGPDVREIPVPPLSEAEAAELFDAQPGAPVGRLRGRMLRLCAGNPLGIVELARTAGSMTLPEPIRRIFAGRLAALPAPTHRVLLYAAAGADERLHTVLTAAGAEVADLAPAERAELVTITGDWLIFRHPLARIACYLQVPADQRRQAHHDLAARLAAEPGRARHLVAAGDSRQERLASFLETSADLSAGQRRYDEAAGQFEDAAALSPDPELAAIRLARAAHLAALHGDALWSRALWDRVGELSTDPDLRGRAMIGSGFAAALAEPVGRTVPRVAELLRAGVRDRDTVVGLVAAAAGDVLIGGRAEPRAQLADILAGSRIADLDGRDAIAVRAAAAAILAPGGPPPAALFEPAEGPTEEVRLLTLAIITWLGDEPAGAVSAGRRALDLLRARRAAGFRPFGFVLFMDSLLETALWREAAEIGAEATEVAVTGRLTVLRRAIAALTATLRVRQGDLTAARAALTAGTTASDSRLVRCLTSRAAGELAAAEGDWDRATTHFLELFHADGTPLHFAWSYRVIADLAAAAAHAGRGAEAVVALDHLRRQGASTPWQTLQHGRASALLGLDDDATAELHLVAATGSAATWVPYQQASARLDLAEWLRSRRRQAEARSQLTAAVEAFRRIGATARCPAAREQLRAAGVAHEPAGARGFAALTAQQQLITRLAAQGLSNREIATRLAVSPRTVGSHLYQIYPKLGVATRRQLVDVVRDAG